MACACISSDETEIRQRQFTGYVVKLSENNASLDFLEFMIRDQASGDVFFEVCSATSAVFFESFYRLL